MEPSHELICPFLMNSGPIVCTLHERQLVTRTHLLLCVFTLLYLSLALDILTGLCVVYKLHSVKFSKKSIMRKTLKSPSDKCVRVTSSRSWRVGQSLTVPRHNFERQYSEYNCNTHCRVSLRQFYLISFLHITLFRLYKSISL